MSDLLALRPWLTLKQAAVYLTEKAGRPFKFSDLYRLALDGHINLSLNLPTGMTGTVRRIENKQVGAGSTEPIDGLWRLPLKGAARRQVEHDYYLMMRLSYISIEGISGAIVVRPDLLCRLSPDPGSTGLYSRSRSAFPEGSVLVVETAVLDEFAATLLSPPVVAPADHIDRPLRTKERRVLLTIIAALCKHANIDIEKPSAAAVTIETMIDALDARVAARTIENHLKSISDALERRGNLSS